MKRGYVFDFFCQECYLFFGFTIDTKRSGSSAVTIVWLFYGNLRDTERHQTPNQLKFVKINRPHGIGPISDLSKEEKRARKRPTQ